MVKSINPRFVRFPNWKAILWLTLASYILNDVVWLFVDGWRQLLDYSDATPMMMVEDLGFSVFFTVTSVAYSWVVLRMLPSHRFQLGGLIAYAFVLFVFNFLLAWGCYAIQSAVHHELLDETDWLKLVFSTAMTASFISSVYFNMQNMRSYVDVARLNMKLERMLSEEREAKLQSQLQTLKMQISPHFMFNNFSILSELIHEDTKLADAFLENLSSVYRYVIQNAERTVVSIREELQFLRSYIMLIQLRYEDTVCITIAEELNDAQGQLPPNSLQLLVENAIKHNSRSTAQPLHISIYKEEDYVVVTNNLQRVEVPDSTHVGLANIMRRYELLGLKKPVIRETERKYIVKLPIIAL